MDLHKSQFPSKRISKPYYLDHWSPRKPKIDLHSQFLEIRILLAPKRDLNLGLLYYESEETLPLSQVEAKLALQNLNI